MNYYEYSYWDIPYFWYIRSSWSDTLCIHQIYDLPTYTVPEWEENMSNQLRQCPHYTSEGTCCESLSLDIISPFLLTTVTQQLEDRPPPLPTHLKLQVFLNFLTSKAWLICFPNVDWISVSVWYRRMKIDSALKNCVTLGKTGNLSEYHSLLWKIRIIIPLSCGCSELTFIKQS